MAPPPSQQPRRPWTSSLASGLLLSYMCIHMASAFHSIFSAQRPGWSPRPSLVTTRPSTGGRGPLSIMMMSSPSSTEPDLETLGLPAKLKKMSQALRLLDERSRVQQLLYMASRVPPLKDYHRTTENKVPGCLSTVYVVSSKKDGKIYFEGDSDAQMTKGLVGLLIDGLSGSTAQEIQEVKPEFILYTGIGATLTPGRNNGFLNMLAVMKKKALEADAKGEEAFKDQPQIDFTEDIRRPMYSAMMKKLINFLKPVRLTMDDDSAQHAGHAGSKGFNGESHFSLKIVAPCFEGLSAVQRHKLIYTILAQEMQQIHALSIDAKTPQEAGVEA